MLVVHLVFVQLMLLYKVSVVCNISKRYTFSRMWSLHGAYARHNRRT